jgi:hypothetical protein
MEWDARSEHHRQCALRALCNYELTVFDLWVAYYGLGGQLNELDIEAFLYGLLALPELEHLLLAEAVRELST